MRYTTFVSLVASLVLLSQSPATNAAPVPSQGGLVGKRGCWLAGCRISEPTDTGTETTSQSEVQNLVGVLINALQGYQVNTPPDSRISDTIL
ncbi:hypothetical protein BGY98DRAFT_1021693 [Russula aff. rugulosa BPL654]|nr:hypothetical protein BGY98DRAFT_1021693 [Russula aff. rugulosa BPL654]